MRRTEHETASRQAPRALLSAFRGWFEAESGGREEDADRALRRVFAHLPMPTVPEGFAERVLERALRPRDRFAFGARRLMVAALLIGTGSVLWALPPAVRAALPNWGLSDAVALLQRFFLALGEALQNFVEVGARILEVRRLTSLFMETPQVLTTLGVCCLLSILAFRWLRELTVPRRSDLYADSF